MSSSSSAKYCKSKELSNMCHYISVLYKVFVLTDLIIYEASQKNITYGYDKTNTYSNPQFWRSRFRRSPHISNFSTYFLCLNSTCIASILAILDFCDPILISKEIRQNRGILILLPLSFEWLSDRLEAKTRMKDHTG